MKNKSSSKSDSIEVSALWRFLNQLTNTVIDETHIREDKIVPTKEVGENVQLVPTYESE